jgi:predicted nucleic acid-binding protein
MGVTSVVTIMELTVRPWQLQKPAIAREYEARLAHFPNLRVVDITRGVARRAALLRAHHGVRPADALQAAAALTHHATLFVTNDIHLRRLTEAIGMLLLDEYV